MIIKCVATQLVVCACVVFTSRCANSFFFSSCFVFMATTTKMKKGKIHRRASIHIKFTSLDGCKHTQTSEEKKRENESIKI